MKKKINKILVFSAHPDDAELGMGGTMHLMRERGLEVKVIDLTDGEPTPCGDPETRKKESEKAASILGFKRETLDYPNRELVSDIEKRDRLAGIIRQDRPDAVFTHFCEDAHPDHREANKIAEDAVFAARLTKSKISGEPFRVEKVYYYYSVHLKKVVVPDFFMPLSTKNHEAKMDALKSYRSQFIDNKQNSRVIDYVIVRDRYWGSLIDSDYGEGFKSRGPIKISVLEDLL